MVDGRRTAQFNSLSCQQSNHDPVHNFCMQSFCWKCLIRKQLKRKNFNLLLQLTSKLLRRCSSAIELKRSLKSTTNRHRYLKSIKMNANRDVKLSLRYSKEKICKSIRKQCDGLLKTKRYIKLCCHKSCWQESRWELPKSTDLRNIKCLDDSCLFFSDRKSCNPIRIQALSFEERLCF